MARPALPERTRHPPVRVLVPDAPWAQPAAWASTPVDVVYYTPSSTHPPIDEGAEVLVVGPGDHTAAYTLAANLPSLRYIQTTYSGIDNWQDRVRPGIQLANTHGAMGVVTAEIMTAGILAMLRGLPHFLANQKRGAWEPFHAETLWRRTVTIVGAGDVGCQLKRQLTAFGANVTLVGRTARDGVCGVDELGVLASTTGILVAATPLTGRTRGLIGPQVLSRLPDGAIVGNIGRGPVVDLHALMTELRTGRLRAVLDVTDPEPLPPDHDLWSMPNVLITPHVGGLIHDAIKEGMRHALEAVVQYAEGGTTKKQAAT